MSRKVVAASIISVVIVATVLVYFYTHGGPWNQNPPQTPPSNSWIMDLPTIEDEKPKSGYGNSQWWAWYGYAYTADNESELLLNANIYPRDGTLYGNSYTLNGVIETFNFQMDIAWNSTTNTLYGTMNRERDGMTGSWRLKFPSDGYRVYEQTVGDETFRLEMWSRGIPLWAAKTEDQMVQAGWADHTPVYGGGFHDCVTVGANLTRNGETKIFNGFGMYARAWLTQIIGNGEAVVGFVNEQPEFYINFMYVRNPYDLSEVFVKHGRIGFPDKAYRFDNFTWKQDAYPRLQWFKLNGSYKDGTVDLTGERIAWLHDRQHHPLIRWTGTITRNGETINVNSLGSGEFRQ